MAFPGMTPPAGGMPPGAGNNMQGMNEQEQAMVKTVSPVGAVNTDQRLTEQMQSAMESCPVKTVMSGTMGFGLGGVFGLFMASVRLDPVPPPQAPKPNN